MDKEKLIETCVSSKEIFDGRVLNVFVDEVKLPNGNHSTREYVKHNGAAAILPLDDDGNVYLVEQYRYAFGKVMTEIPAGKLDSKGEDPYEAALRELKEETGFTSNNVVPLGAFVGSPALIGETIWLYFARDLKKGEQHLDSDEFLNVKKIPLDELVKKVMDGEITDGKTAYAVLKVKAILDAEK